MNPVGPQRHSTGALVLVGASVTLTPRQPLPSDGTLSVLFTGRVLSLINVLLAQLPEFAAADLAGPGEAHTYELATSGMRIDLLSEDPVVHLRSQLLAGLAVVRVDLTLQITDDSALSPRLVTSDIGEMRLDAQNPTATAPLPRAMLWE